MANTKTTKTRATSRLSRLVFPRRRAGRVRWPRSRWSRADLASALARVELGARHAAFEAERARVAADELAERESLERESGQERSGTHQSSPALVDLRRCAAALAEFVGDSEPRRRARARTPRSWTKSFSLCARTWARATGTRKKETQ